MAQLTANRETDRKDGKLLALDVAASTTLYKGGFINVNTSGYAVAGTDTAGEKFAGVSYEKIDNSAGAAADKKVRVFRDGLFLFDIGSAAITDVGKRVYLSDDQTVTFTQADIFVGIVVARASATTVWIDIAPATQPEQAHEIILHGSLTAATTTTGGDALNLSNPFNQRVVVLDLVLDVSTPATGAATVDAGVAATLTTDDSLLDAADVGTAAIVANAVEHGGTNGLRGVAWPAASFVTVTPSASLVGLVGTYYVKCLVPVAA